jgi:hypothetical protein
MGFEHGRPMQTISTRSGGADREHSHVRRPLDCVNMNPATTFPSQTSMGRDRDEPKLDPDSAEPTRAKRC